MAFHNSYEDVIRAKAYAELEFTGTYHLAYRDLSEILGNHVHGLETLDFGCGTGRSTRFLKNLGFNVVGVDISETMINRAKMIDCNGNYQIVQDEHFDQFREGIFDLVFSAFTFDNIPTREKKINNLREIARILKTDGTFINLVSSPEIYTHEWASFSTKDFPENKQAKSGDVVKIIITEITDRRPVKDIIWYAKDYQQVYTTSKFAQITSYKPLAKESEPYNWVNETKIAPWVIYVLKKT